MENNRVVYTSSPGWLQTQRPNGGEQRRVNNNNPNRRNRSQNHTPSAPPAVYSIPDASSEKPPEVSFNPPTYEEAITGNVYWDPSAPDTKTDNK